MADRDELKDANGASTAPTVAPDSGPKTAGPSANPGLIIDRVIDDRAPTSPPVLNTWAREHLVAMAHPTVLRQVNGFQDLGFGAIRWAQGLGLNETESHNGSQVNAFRHTLWQASFVSAFSPGIARDAANAHEDNPSAIAGWRTRDRPTDEGPPIYGVGDLTEKVFSGANADFDTDESVDLANNVIGRLIGIAHRGAGMKVMARAVLERYHDTGLWEAVRHPDGTMQAAIKRLPDPQYAVASAKLEALADNGTPVKPPR